MKALILFTLVLLTATAFTQENDTSIHFTPSEGGIQTGQSFTVIFPEAMVGPEVINQEGQVSPLVFDPKLKGKFWWRSQSEGVFTITDPVIPGSAYKATLRKNLKALDGKKLAKGLLDGNYESVPLTVTPKFRSFGSQLPSVPSVRLLFNNPVEFSSAAKSIYFQDRTTRERFAATVLIPGIRTKDKEPSPEAPLAGSDLTVEAEQPLPVGRKIDLIVEGLRDAATKTLIPFTKTITLGESTPLRVTEVEAFGSALAEPALSIYFSSGVELDSVDENTITISPEVPNLRRETSGRVVVLKGEFDLTADYTINVSPPLLSTTGYALTESYSKTVSFGGYNPEIWFPSQMFFQRSALGLNVKFLHANTKSVNWRLAPIPDHKIGIVRERLSSGKELVLDSLGLEPVASGDLPGTSTIEASYRDIVWNEAPLSGAYLLEVSTPLRSGKLAGHRAMIFFNDIVITQKRTAEEVIFKITRMADMSPVANAKVRAVCSDNELRATGKSDAEGIVRFPYPTLYPVKAERAHHLLIDSDAGRAIQFIELPKFSNSGWISRSKEESLRSVIFTDRNLYRPGSTVKFKGIVRKLNKEELAVSEGQKVQWSIKDGNKNKVIATGEATTDGFGGWEGEWISTANQSLGSYSIKAGIGSVSVGYQWFQVEEYRTPLFNIGVTDESKAGNEATRIQVQSNYFHGSPNAGARVEWGVSWSTGNGVDIYDMATVDSYSENRLTEPVINAQSGEFKLDANGSGLIDLPLPVTKPLYASGLYYSVSVDVTSPEGRTISSGVYESRPVIPFVPAINANPVYAENEKAVEVALKTVSAVDEKEMTDLPMTVELYHVFAQTVKEKIAPGVFRYRNFERFEITAIEKGSSGTVMRFPVLEPGRYVAVASLDGNPDAPRVSQSVSVAADAPAQYEVETSTTFALRPDKESYKIGETAILASESPFAGKAWVSMETHGIIEQFVVDVPENASQIQIPIKPEYYPNVYATVYLVNPGGADHLPVERFGRTHLVIDRPELNLKVEPSLTKEEVEPGKDVQGSIFVSCEGKPFANADVTVMAVDEAVLQLGSWELPDLVRAFYPSRMHGVTTYQALTNHHEDFDESDMVEKGFLIGGGGEGDAFSQQKMRKNFLARAFWKTELRTDENGKVAFDFQAPDNLTAFRVTAVASSKASQFGHGKTTLRVAKRLMAEPALPRFVRHGDQLELRVVVRQTAAESAVTLVKCQTTGGIELLGEGVAEPAELRDGVPQVFRFPAKVTSYEPAVIRFAADYGDIGDAVETTIPVYAPGILQATGRYGEIPAGAEPFKLAENVPEFWQNTSGSFGLTLSYNQYIPKLTGLPTILDYPHGCMEQKSSRYLAYTVLADLLNFLPDLQGRHENYAQRIEDGLQMYQSSLIEGKFLPYWPGSTSKNYYVTALATWVTLNALQAGIEVPEDLLDSLGEGLDEIIRGQTDASDDVRAFALFVAGEKGHADVARDLYMHRDRMSDEGRSQLAIAMQAMNVLPDEKAQLIREIATPLEARAFDPASFYSTTRAHAMRFIAVSRTGGDTGEMKERLLKLMDSSWNLSTQENLWLLIAFKELNDSQEFATFDEIGEQISKNKVSVAWKERGLEKIKEMVVQLENTQPAYYLVNAKVMRSGANMVREDRGIRLERVVQNLTEEKRIGSEKAPFKLGDEVLVTYRMNVKNIQHYTALVDELPAAMETLNPNLAQVAQFYQLPAGAATLDIDYSELRDQSANLYFDRVAPGQHTYSILTRITSVGTFTWPGASMTPMYETRFGGMSGTNDCYVIE
jgi:uncharacterized protein YfaS (alpha-2-macroglobulin family)